MHNIRYLLYSQLQRFVFSSSSVPQALDDGFSLATSDRHNRLGIPPRNKAWSRKQIQVPKLFVGRNDEYIKGTNHLLPCILSEIFVLWLLSAMFGSKQTKILGQSVQNHKVIKYSLINIIALLTHHYYSYQSVLLTGIFNFFWKENISQEIKYLSPLSFIHCNSFHLNIYFWYVWWLRAKMHYHW